MKKQLVVIGIIVLLVVVGLSGCFDSVSDDNTVEITGSNVTQTINRPGKTIKLEITGSNCDITVTMDTILSSMEITGSNCIVRVSRTHSFTSEITGSNSEIVYYD